MRSAAPRRTGFTLVELLVVVAILTILAGIATVSLGDGAQQALEMAEIQIGDAFDWARARAKALREPHGVVFDVAGDRFAIVDESGAEITDPTTRKPYVVDFQSPNQPKRIDISGADFGTAGAAALFDAQGVPLTSGTVTLQRGDLTFTLTLDAATGELSRS